MQAQTGNINISGQLLQTITCRADRERNTQNQPSILTTTEAVGVVDEQVLDVGDGFVLSVEHRHAAAAVGVLLPVQQTLAAVAVLPGQVVRHRSDEEPQGPGDNHIVVDHHYA